MAYPKDRFDELPDDLQRIGAHRGPGRGGRGWIAFAWAALATLVLIVGGIVGLRMFMGIEVDIPFLAAAPSATPVATSEPTPTAEPVLDPTTIDPARAITTSIYNGTATAELQNTVGDALTAAGWTIDARARASTSDVATTTVYYSDPANEDVARGLVVALGVGEISLVPAESFPGNPLNIVLGADYPGATPAG